jgi:hypothetical protein
MVLGVPSLRLGEHERNSSRKARSVALIGMTISPGNGTTINPAARALLRNRPFGTANSRPSRNPSPVGGVAGKRCFTGLRVYRVSDISGIRNPGYPYRASCTDFNL